MEDDSDAEGVNVEGVNGFLFVVGDDLWCDKAGSAALCEDDVGFVMEGGQSVVDYLEPLLGVAFLEGVLLFEEDVLGFDVAVHNALLL